MNPALIVMLGFLSAGVFGASNYTSCPRGWISYTTGHPNTCLIWSTSSVRSLTTAHNECVEKNASLLVIDTEDKFTFFKNEITSFKNTNGMIPSVWMGMVRDSNRRTKWKVKDGFVDATYIPTALRFNNWPQSSYESGLVYSNNGYLSKGHDRYNYNSKNARFICEKRPGCKKGWYGLACDRQCHCNNEDCDPTALEIKCSYGCQIGWMGADCSQPKKDAEVRYFCVNSRDQGKYVHIFINKKGVNYDNIQAVDGKGQWISWCNSTDIQTNSDTDSITIKTFVVNSTDQDLRNGTCAGKISKAGVYEWRLKLQEHHSLVSRNDREVSVECNFDTADDFMLTDKTEINSERWFRKSSVMKVIEYLKEKKESVKLSVVDPSTGNAVDAGSIGTSVVLRINFAIDADNVATGVSPYNCRATSSDGKQAATFLDGNGCPVAGNFPISQFHKNGTKSLITEPFPLFGFDETQTVEFHCSYRLCFENNQCEGCIPVRTDLAANVTGNSSINADALSLQRNIHLK